VSSIKSNEFLNKLYKYLDNQRNQGTYVIDFFNAAGSRYFLMPAAYPGRTNESLEGERHYAKDRTLTPEIKRSFPNPINIEELSAFIDKNLLSNKLAACMVEFGIPSGVAQEKDKFSHALAEQFSLFVTSADNEVIDNVWEFYQTLLSGQQISIDDISGPRYSGDDVYVEYRDKDHKADCYEIVRHTWKMQNRGTQVWHDRKLVLVNQDEIHPRPESPIIPIPDTKRNEFAKVAVDVDARGFEGNYECKWEMQDPDDIDCFPNKHCDFNFKICVTFHTSSEEGKING
jgi:hypothetical protein